MDQVQSEKMIAEMNAFLAESGDASVSGNEKPEAEDLPFESLDDYSTDPMEFGELAERMSVKVETIFDLSVMYNRHSPKYLKACAMLEKGIKYLACCCITRVALKEQGDLNAGLDDLSVEKLYRMVSFNYRKLDTAHTEKLAKSCELYPELTDMVFRYFNLLLRLRTTEAKIFSYNFKAAYKTKDYTPAMQGLAFTPKSWNRSFNDLRPDRKPVFHRAPSFPVLRDVVGTEAMASRKPAAVSHTKAEPHREATPVVTKAETVNAEPVPAEEPPALPPASKGLKPEPPKGWTKPERTPLIREARDFRDILEDAKRRSKRADEGLLEFSHEEMLCLAVDQEFRYYYPEAAEEIRHLVLDPAAEDSS